MQLKKKKQKQKTLCQIKLATNIFVITSTLYFANYFFQKMSLAALSLSHQGISQRGEAGSEQPMKF